MTPVASWIKSPWNSPSNKSLYISLTKLFDQQIHNHSQILGMNLLKIKFTQQ